MHSHPFFNLRLHTNEDLAELIGANIRDRITLHEWPLSCVQKLILSDGCRLVYKASWGPTVEAEIYARINLPLLPAARTIYQLDGYVCLLIDWVDAPMLEDLDMPEPELVQLGRALQSEFRKLPQDLPCYLDLREDGWGRVMDQIMKPLRVLLQNGKLVSITEATIDQIEYWGNESSLQDALKMDVGLVHGDLTGDNLFIVEDGCRLIDWQRPMYGPQALDLVSLLESAGFGASRHVDPRILRLKRLLEVHWLTQCADRWFPDGVRTYDQQIAEIVSQMEAY